MHRLTRLNPAQFDWTHNFKLGCVIRPRRQAEGRGNCTVLARFVKVPPLWHGLTGYDAVIRVEEWPGAASPRSSRGPSSPTSSATGP